MIEPSIWSKLHGAATHFPIALVFVSAFCDAASLACRREDLRRGLRFTATVTIVLATLGGFGAAVTGLIITRWTVWGHATLLRHHQFVWPALVLMTALTIWRIISRGKASRAQTRAYLAVLFLTVALIGGAGYWGGELLNEG